MRHLLIFLLTATISTTLASGAGAAKGFDTASINIGYMSQEEFGHRVQVAELADYIKRLQAACTEFFAESTTAEDLEIVVAAKPGKVSRVWFISSRKPEAEEHRDDLRQKLEAVAVPAVRFGPIAFAIDGQIAGEIAKGKPKADGPPTPAEWEDAIAKLSGPSHFDALLEKVWPNPPGSPEAGMEAPEGFVVETLNPIGGKLFRPKDWFFEEEHRPKVLMWTASREDISKGGKYVTGVRIQVLMDIKKNTGKSPKDFILEFVESKKKAAAKVIETCAEKDQGLFTRICLQTEEGPHRILYSLFWGNKDPRYGGGKHFRHDEGTVGNLRPRFRYDERLPVDEPQGREEVAGYS